MNLTDLIQTFKDKKSFTEDKFYLFFQELKKRQTEDLSYLNGKERYEKFLTLTNIAKFDKEQIFNFFQDKSNNSGCIKLGIDPSSELLHLGHLVPIRLLRIFSQMGYNATIIIGDFTAMIGDPSLRSYSRQALSEEEVKNNMSSYREQITPFVEVNKIQWLYNSHWLNAINFKKLLQIGSKIQASVLLQREDFRKRLENSNSSLTVTELLYPLAMAYDSYYIKAFIELGGVDQLINVYTGRNLMKALGVKPQLPLLTPLLPGIHGKEKMSKSIGGAIYLNDSSEVLFDKIMKIDDILIKDYYLLCTDCSNDEVEFLSTLEIILQKQLLAMIIISTIYSIDKAIKEYNSFVKRFTKKEPLIRKELQFLLISEKYLIDIIIAEVAHIKTRSDVRRIARQNGLKIAVDRNHNPIILHEEVIYKKLIDIVKGLLNIEFKRNQTQIFLNIGKYTLVIK